MQPRPLPYPYFSPHLPSMATQAWDMQPRTLPFPYSTPPCPSMAHRPRAMQPRTMLASVHSEDALAPGQARKQARLTHTAQHPNGVSCALQAPDVKKRQRLAAVFVVLHMEECMPTSVQGWQRGMPAPLR